MCQVHIAVSTLVRSWWLDRRRSAALLQRAADIITHWQRRNAAARSSHTKTTLRKLRRMGIRPTDLIRCKWD